MASHPTEPKRLLSNIPEPKTKSGKFGGCVNLTNAIVGSGIIGIPFAVKESGLILGLFLLAFVAFLGVRSLRIIVETASYHPKLKSVGVKTYEDLMFMPFGNRGSHFILANKFIFAYGSMVAYLLIIKDTVPAVLGMADDQVMRQVIMVVTSLVIMLPLSLLRDMASLAWTSLLSVAADVVLIVFMCIYAPLVESVNAAGGFLEVLKENAVNNHFFIGLGIISQAMTCHPLALIISESLEVKSPTGWASVTRYSLSTAWLLCSIVGLVGLLAFLNETQANVLNNFAIGSIAANGSRGVVAITMIFTYPMQCFVARHVIAKVFFNGDSEGDFITSDEGVQIAQAKFLGCIGRRAILTISIYAATLLPALIFNDLGPVLSITGAVGGSCLAYIGPGLVYLGAHGDAFMEYTNDMLKQKSSGVDAATAIPAEGNAAATMDTAVSGTAPFWWYLVLMPVWRKIAVAGGSGMTARLALLEEASPGCTTTAPTGETVSPEHGTYYLAMFMVVFGIFALVLGVASNVVVSLND